MLLPVHLGRWLGVKAEGKSLHYTLPRRAVLEEHIGFVGVEPAVEVETALGFVRKLETEVGVEPVKSLAPVHAWT